MTADASTELELRCRCGSVRGHARDVAPPRGLHLTCHCRDCQAFAHFLDRAELVLDAWGGSAVVQIAPARLELVDGREHLACVRLSASGLMRWYASCCNAPIANTLAKPGVPFAGLHVAFIDPGLDADARADRIGPSRARVNGPGRPRGGVSVKIDAFPVRVLARSILNLARSWRRGEHWPSPFFDADGEPRARPRVLSEAERAELYARVDSA